MVFLAGIPGTVGGALRMNAGVGNLDGGGWFWDHVISVKTINRFGEIKMRLADSFIPSYRSVDGLSSEEWFVSARLIFACSDISEAKRRVQCHLQRRKDLLPLDLPNSGSVFLNPPAPLCN